MPGSRIRVGISEFPPLVALQKSVPIGFEVDLWEAIAAELGLETEYHRSTLQGLLQKTARTQLDVSFAGISKTEARERTLDFTHATYRGGLSVLVRTRGSKRFFPALWAMILRRRKTLLAACASVLVFIVLISHLLWFVERGQGSFDAVYARGIQDTAWYTVVTMSTVGYGDFVPVTALGRVIGAFTIIIGYAIFVFFIAELNTLLILERTQGLIHSAQDLSRRTVATVRKTISETLLQKYQATTVTTPTFQEAVDLLIRGEVDAVVFDAPVVQHYVREQGSGVVHIVGPRFEEHDYAFIVPEGSPMRERINRALLLLMENGTYDRLYRRWFGVA